MTGTNACMRISKVFSVSTDRTTDPFDTERPSGVGLGKRLTHRLGCHAQSVQFGVEPRSLVRTCVVVRPMAFGLRHKPRCFCPGFLTLHLPQHLCAMLLGL